MGRKSAGKINFSRLLSMVSVLLILGLIVKLVIDLAPLFRMVADNTANESVTIEYISSYGKRGMPVIIGLQALQVIVAFFPAAPIQAIAGVCYGMWKGLVLCMLGYLVGNVLVFWTIRQFRNTLEPLFRKKEAARKSKINLNYIKTLEHPERLSFALYLIPCIPNGIIPYLFAFSKVKMGAYLLSVLLASIPSILLCTWIGQLIAVKEYLAAAAVTILVILLTVLAFANKKRLTNLFTKGKDAQAAGEITYEIVEEVAEEINPRHCKKARKE